MNRAILEQAESILRNVPEETRREVLSLISQAMNELPTASIEIPAVSPNDFKSVFGIWSKETADEIDQIVKDGFERIDSSEWENHSGF